MLHQSKSSSFAVKDAYDYQGRSYLHIPQDIDTDVRSETPPEKCYLPKKHIHSWTGHTKGVASIKLFPKSGHLLLSCGMDCKIKVGFTIGVRDSRCLEKSF